MKLITLFAASPAPSPPAKRPLVEFDVAVGKSDATVLSPKSVTFPVVEIVINSSILPVPG